MDDRELGALYARCGYGLYRRCLAYLGDEAEAQDAVQEVFARALQAADRYLPEAEPIAWLRRIADHLCVDLLRRRRRSPLRALGDDDAATARGASSVGPVGEHAALVGRLLRTLSPDEVRLAVLYYLDGLTQDELASTTGLSRKTIGKRLGAITASVRALVAAPEGG